MISTRVYGTRRRSLGLGSTRRISLRVPIGHSLFVQEEGSAAILAAQVVDIGVGGALIAGHGSATPGAQMLCRLQPQCGKCVDVPASLVRRLDGGHFAVRFEHDGHESERRLAGMIQAELTWRIAQQELNVLVVSASQQVRHFVSSVASAYQCGELHEAVAPLDAVQALLDSADDMTLVVGDLDSMSAAKFGEAAMTEFDHVRRVVLLTGSDDIPDGHPCRREVQRVPAAAKPTQLAVALLD